MGKHGHIMNSRFQLPSFLYWVVCFSAAGLFPAAAQLETAFTYQGRLTGNGTPFTGSAEFQPTLWTAESGGSQVAANSPATHIVGVTNGLFVLPLDFGASPFGVGAERWLQLEVRTAIGAFSTLSPRQQLTATPYALTAGNLTGTLPAAQLSGTVPDALIPATITRDTEVIPLVLANDGAGSGLDADLLDGLNSTAFIRTNGPVAISGSNTTAAILTVTQSSSHNGVLATTASTTAGRAALVGQAGAAGPTLNGVAGVFGTSTAGRGVIGSSASHDGVLGYSTSGRGVVAQSHYGYGLSALSATNYAVHGVGNSRAGIRGESSFGNGVEGHASATSGTGYGVSGESRSTTAGAGVRGESAWVGVWGESSGRWGVYGRSTGTSNSYGVYGTVSAGSGNYAGYFSGNVNVSGTLSKGGGSFKIDHPLDPANKYLSHSFVESPDMMNVYNGNVTLDETGTAWVTLPAYFEALNSDFRYQLTPIGGPGPNLHVAEPVRSNAFKVAGGTAGLQVSWQVTGIRQDSFANANRIVVEEFKPAEERGTYLHPGGRVQPTEPDLRHALDTDPNSPAK
jgi:hypothetical protein